jgi:hypothetical protein
MTYADPNGEIQTISSVIPVWPAAVVAGIKNEDWVSVKNKTRFTAIALDTNGKPMSDVPLVITGIARHNDSHRRRIVGGFYAYENAESSKELGQLCKGKSDARGLLICEVEMTESGNIELQVKASDNQGGVLMQKPRSGSQAKVRSGLMVRIRIAWMFYRRKNSIRLATSQAFRCACLSALRQHWLRSNAKV